MKVLLLGGSGHLGSELMRQLGENVVAPIRTEFDLTRLDQIPSSLDFLMPELIVNAAAFTNVDDAESNRELAMILNAEAPRAIAEWSARRRVPLLHLSTNYVFPGDGSQPWSEVSRTEPVNFYGVTKLRGEKEVQDAGGEHLIIRTAWLFGRGGDSFLRRILRLASESEQLNVVADQVGSPTFAEDLACSIASIVRRRRDHGVIPVSMLHLANSGWARRDEFVATALRAALDSRLLKSAPSVVAIQTSDTKTPARRPLNSRLDCSEAQRRLGISLPHWSTSLSRCLTGFQL